MAFSRQLRYTHPPMASSSTPNYCRFCGKYVIDGSYFNLKNNEPYLTKTIARLNYMNITASRKFTMNICKPCFLSFKSAYNFCRIYNRTQCRVGFMDIAIAREAEEAEKNRVSGPIIRALDDIKVEPESGDDMDVGLNDDLVLLSNPIVDSNKSWCSYTWTCCHCDAEYSELSALRSHSKREHEVCFAFECPDCDIKLNEYQMFILHLRNHKENLR